MAKARDEEVMRLLKEGIIEPSQYHRMPFGLSFRLEFELNVFVYLDDAIMVTE